jgi:hypothetical protein
MQTFMKPRNWDAYREVYQLAQNKRGVTRYDLVNTLKIGGSTADAMLKRMIEDGTLDYTLEVRSRPTGSPFKRWGEGLCKKRVRVYRVKDSAVAHPRYFQGGNSDQGQ